MSNLITASLFFLAAGIFTSVTILSAYQILFALPLIFYLFQAFKEKKFVLPLSAWMLVAFSLYTFVGIALNFEILPKPMTNIGKIKYFLFGAFGVFVFRAWIPSASIRAKKIISNTFLLSIVVSSCMAIYMYSLTGERTGGFVDIMRYGYGTAMTLLVLISTLLHKEKLGSWFNPKFAALAIVFAVIGLFLSQTRGAMLGFLCGLPFVLYYYRPKLGKIFGALALVGVVALGSVYLFGQGPFENRYLMNKDNSSDTVRRNIWRSSAIAISERPITGWGLSNFHTQLERISRGQNFEMHDMYDTHSHNVFLEIGAGTGLVGLTFFVLWLFFWAYETFKRATIYKALVIPFGVALVVSGQFENILDANNASMIFFFYAITSVDLNSEIS